MKILVFLTPLSIYHFGHLNDQLKGMYHSGCGSVHEAPNMSCCVCAQAQRGKLVIQIAVEFFVINFCHTIVSLSGCFLIITFFLDPTI